MVQFSFSVAAVCRVCVRLVVPTCMLLASASYAQRNPVLPAPPAASPTPLKFDSVLTRYKPMTDQKLGAWREANDTVARVGGWRAYLKDAQTPDVMAPGAVTNVPAAPDLAVPTVPGAPTKANPHKGHEAKP